MLRADGTKSLGHGQQPSPHHGSDRRVAAPATDRLHRPLPIALRRPGRAARRDARRARRGRVRAGKVRYIGCSNFLAYRLARAIGRSETLGLARFDSVQPRYNLLFREFERELFPLCLEEGVGVIPYNPLAGGMLSGKHPRGQPPAEGTRFTISNAGAIYQERYWHEREFDTV